MSKSKTSILAAAIVAFTSSASAETAPFDSGDWTIEAGESRIERHLGRQSLYLSDGAALLKDVAFENGVIEFDIAVTGERGFEGVLWRLRGDGNYEHFYIRPHQSGKPDANQYTPVFNGVAGWQLYHGAGYSVPLEYAFDRWMHVKLVVSGNKADIYIDSDKPVLHVPELKHGAGAGAIGLTANVTPAWFSNFSFEAIAKPELVKSEAAQKPAPDNAVMRWRVSSPFDEATLGATLPDGHAEGLTWQTLEAEPTGIANLARLHGTAEGADTLFARLIVQSGHAQVKKLSFGYSDRVKAYLNGRLIYGGDNTYRSRDFRYLGTIGLFDALYLPLEAGDNELMLAVSESFGGWGVIAAFDDMAGIEVK